MIAAAFTPTLFAVHLLATTNAVLNAVAAVLLVAGWAFIRRGNVRAHRASMVAAFVVSAVFLVSYLAYHATAGSVRFQGRGGVRIVYFVILVSHVILAAAVPILALRMFLLAWRGRWDAHRRLGRVTLPIWLYVSVTGVVIYLMLYHLFPGPLPVPGPLPAVPAAAGAGGATIVARAVDSPEPGP